ncbi:MAG: hypothetical protein HC846_04845 [Blastocatellia bacterium]|nr:hypothetical protein [Blastocatellia bacterium]
MSWLLSVAVASLIFAAPNGLSNYLTENMARGNSPQVVVLTPQAVLQGDETERFEQTYPLNPNGRVSISNINGSIVVEAWDRNEVKVEAVKTADSKDRLAEVEIKVEAKPDYIKIETEYGKWMNGNRNWNCRNNCRLEVQYKLFVPRNAVLNEIETVNGSVSISNTSNVTNASAVNGSVKAINLRGTARIETVNGTSEIDFDSLNSDSKIVLTTVNGRVNLLLPSDVDATIKADTVNGNINNEFGLPVRKGKYVGRDLYGKVGDGTVKINLESVNGGLNIRRKQDGKNPKPVVNLLNMKEDADDEDGVDVAAEVTNIGKMNKTIAKSVKESTKIAVEESLKIAEESPLIVEKALKDAEKALNDNAKEIEKALKDAERIQRDVQRDAQRIQRDAERMERDLARTYTQAFGQNWAENLGGINARRIEEVSDTIEVKGTPKVTIDAKKCSVSVRGWDNNEVKYKVTKIIRGVIQPNVDVKVNNTGSEITINAILKGQKVKSVSGKHTETVITPENDGQFTVLPENAVRIEVFVPKKSNLRILTDREIRVEGVTGSIDLSGGDEAINVRDSEGTLKLTAADALVRVIGFTGVVDSKTADGTSFFEGDFEKFSARTVDGKIIITLPEDANADIEANTKINTEGFNLTEFGGDENRRRIGEGGNLFQLKVGEGEILVRNAKTLNVK